MIRDSFAKKDLEQKREQSRRREDTKTRIGGQALVHGMISAGIGILICLSLGYADSPPTFLTMISVGAATYWLSQKIQRRKAGL